MCVIIIKNPGITIPKPMIESACHVNADGFGISILKDGELLTFKNYDKKGNDPDEVWRLMQEYHQLPQYIHLRYTTKGEKSQDNCHPFPLIETEGFTLNLMHNGTLYDFGPQDKDVRSDTRIFAEEFAKPLSEAFFARNGDTMLEDPVYQKIMEKYSGNGFLVTYDNKGNYYIAGGKGFAHEGWWSSNTYSFDRAHREPKVTRYGGSTYSGHSSSSYGTNFYDKDADEDSCSWANTSKGPPWGNEYRRADGVTMIWSVTLGRYIETAERKALPASTSIPSTVPAATPAVVACEPVNDDGKKGEEGEKTDEPVPFRKLFDTEESSYQSKLLGYALAEAKRKGLSFADHPAPAKRATFLELSGMTNLEDVCLLDVDEIEDLVTELPEAATLLIMDLIYELYTRVRAAKRSAA